MVIRVTSLGCAGHATASNVYLELPSVFLLRHETSLQNGTISADMFDAATMGLDGSVVLAGYTAGDWAAENQGGNDFAAVKLDADGTLLWQWQVTQLPVVVGLVLYNNNAPLRSDAC